MLIMMALWLALMGFSISSGLSHSIKERDNLRESQDDEVIQHFSWPSLNEVTTINPDEYFNFTTPSPTEMTVCIKVRRFSTQSAVNLASCAGRASAE